LKALKYAGVTLLLTLLLNFVFSLSPTLYEWLYFRTVFQYIRFVYDHSIAFLPFPMIYISLLLVVVAVFYLYKRRKMAFWHSLLVCIIWIINLFYILWAFNYNQLNLRSRLGLESGTVDSTYITKEFHKQTAIITELLDTMSVKKSPIQLETILREEQEKILSSWSWPVLGRVRVRSLPPGALLHFRTSGIYIPHAFEGHLDAGLHPIQHPFTMAHEMAHGYGITDESECNFIAYLTCIQSDQHFIRYSAELAYWRYLASYYRRLHSESWAAEYAKLDPRLLNDLSEIREQVNRFKDWMPKYRDLIYDSYLKTHGVKAGIRSYDLMIVLIKAYRENKENI
jgi:hypothetical protein